MEKKTAEYFASYFVKTYPDDFSGEDGFRKLNNALFYFNLFHYHKHKKPAFENKVLLGEKEIVIDMDYEKVGLVINQEDQELIKNLKKGN